MARTPSLIVVEEALSIRVGRWLIERGFFLADWTGQALQSLERDSSLGILIKNPLAKPVKHFFGLVTRMPRREFLGTIRFCDCYYREEKNWEMEVFGREQVELMMTLAEVTELTFNVKVSVHLEGEMVRYERFNEDYY